MHKYYGIRYTIFLNISLAYVQYKKIICHEYGNKLPVHGIKIKVKPNRV